MITSPCRIIERGYPQIAMSESDGVRPGSNHANDQPANHAILEQRLLLSNPRFPGFPMIEAAIGAIDPNKCLPRVAIVDFQAKCGQRSTVNTTPVTAPDTIGLPTTGLFAMLHLL